MATKTAPKVLPKLHKALVDTLPKEVALVGDLLYKTREVRLKDNKVIEALEKQEKDCKAYLITNLPKGSASGVSGKLAHVQVDNDVIPQVADWDKFYAHIKKTGHWDLLNRAVNVKSVRERWDAGKEVPGVVKFNVVKVSCTKR